MPLYSYKAYNPQNQHVIGTVAASSKDELAAELVQQQLTPLSIKEVKNTSLSGRLPTIEKITLCRYIATMLKAGLTLTESIEVLAAEVKHPVTKRILEEVKFGLNHGQTLSGILAKFPNSFDTFFVTLIHSGEVSGTLAETFEQLQEEIRAEYSLMQKIQASLMYPVVVFVAMIGIGVLMFFFILPQIGKVFMNLRLELNPFVNLLFTVVLALSNYKYHILVGSLGAVGGLIAIFRTQMGRKTLNAMIKPVPVVKNLIKQIDIARFCRTFSTLMSSGVAITQALEISLSSMMFASFQKSSGIIIEKVSKGEPLAQAFRGTKIFPPLLIQMMVAGEKSGTLDTSLRDLAEFYEEEVENAIKKLTQLIEPMLMLLVGIGVGVMVLAVITPIYSVVSNLQGSR